MSYPHFQISKKDLAKESLVYPFSYDFGKYARASRGHWCNEDGHEPVQNGAQRSWCKHCDIDMIFEWKENKYVVVAKPVEGKPNLGKGVEL